MAKTRILVRLVRAGALLVVLSPLSGCLVAAAGAAGAGAAAGVYLSDRGASALVEGSMPSVDERTQAVLRDLGVQVTETRAATDGSRREFRGHTPELEVVVVLEARSAASTQVSATARRSTLDWDRAYARILVQRVVERQ